MKTLSIAYLLCIALMVCFVATCSRRPTEPSVEPADPLALQHCLSRALDSVDRAACGAPPGCHCIGLLIDCPNPEPPGHP